MAAGSLLATITGGNRMGVTRIAEVSAAGVTVPAASGGTGRPLLYLHDFLGATAEAACHARLSERFRVLAPWLPGFGPTQLPRQWHSVHDLAYFVLDLLEAQGQDDTVLVGAGFGGWIAAEAAIRNTKRIGALVLIDALGVKHSGRNERDIADIHSMAEADAQQLLWHTVPPAPDYRAMNEQAVSELVRSRESFTYLGWKPYMHNPDLKGWLRRIDRPTLVLWGEQDRFVAPDYGRAFAAAIPGARFETVGNAGHFPQIEAADAVADKIVAFAAR